MWRRAIWNCAAHRRAWRIARENLATIDELLDLTRQRRAAGLTTEIDVSNAAAQSLATRAEVPAFELRDHAEHQPTQPAAGPGARGAARRIGRAPAPVPAVPTDVSIGLPAELARRRPDIREAEANLHAATAQIGVAVANLFPRLTLGATAGFQSAERRQSARVGQPLRLGRTRPRSAGLRSRPLENRASVRRARAGGRARLSAHRAQRAARSRERARGLRRRPAAPRLARGHGRAESRCSDAVAAALRRAGWPISSRCWTPSAPCSKTSWRSPTAPPPSASIWCACIALSAAAGRKPPHQLSRDSAAPPPTPRRARDPSRPAGP